MELTDTGAVSPSGHLPFRSANGSWVLPFDRRPTFLAIKSQDCQFASVSRDQTDVQVKIPSQQIDFYAKQLYCNLAVVLRLFSTC